MDKIYITPDEQNIYYLDCTRIDGTNEITSRKTESLESQIKRISSSLEEKQIVLADDVVFSGGVLRKIIELFEQEGVEVIKIISEISTKIGYEYFNKYVKNGLKANILLGDEVMDQICERDFYFGIAGSGILVKTSTSFAKAPYFEPFGNPYERASIPIKDAKTFSKGCIERSIILWEEIDTLKGAKTKIKELPEKIINVKDEEEVVKVLRMKGRYL